MRPRVDTPTPDPVVPRLFTLIDSLAEYGRWLGKQKGTPIPSDTLASEDEIGASDNDLSKPSSMGSLSHAEK